MSSISRDMGAYVLARYHRRMNEAREQLGGACTECGSVEDLEFDHVDPATKEFTIGQGAAGFSEARLQAELAKCQLLCHECHVEKSRRDGDMSHMVLGERNGSTKLTVAQVLEIRGLLEAGGRTLHSIAIAFGVSDGNVRAIRDGRTWQHI